MAAENQRINYLGYQIATLEKRIAALELALKNGKDDVELYAFVRKPYQPRPSLVKVGPDGSLEAK